LLVGGRDGIVGGINDGIDVGSDGILRYDGSGNDGCGIGIRSTGIARYIVRYALVNALWR
jgi:hypothetical protein